MAGSGGGSRGIRGDLRGDNPRKVRGGPGRATGPRQLGAEQSGRQIGGPLEDEALVETGGETHGDGGQTGGCVGTGRHAETGMEMQRRARAGRHEDLQGRETQEEEEEVEEGTGGGILVEVLGREGSS